MQKRYLAMMMAVVMCFGLFITGAMAADEGTETPVETTETTAETTVEVTESAVPSEQPVASEAPADVPQVISLGNDGEGDTSGTSTTPVADGEALMVQGTDAPSDDNTLSQTGIVIEGYGGTVIFYAWEKVASANLSWSSPAPKVVSCENVDDEYTLKLTLSPACAAGSYPFTITGTDFHGALEVLSLEQAKAKGKISYEGFELYKYTTVNDANGAEIRIPNATFAVYSQTPEPVLPEPVATFTTDENGTAKITPKQLTGAYPSLNSSNYYYIKDISGAGTVANCSYAAVTEYDEFEAKAELQSRTDGATTGLKFTFSVPTYDNEEHKHFLRYTDTASGTRKLKVYAMADMVHDSFDLYAWTKKNVTWKANDGDVLTSETDGYAWETVMLPGAEFTLYKLKVSSLDDLSATSTKCWCLMTRSRWPPSRPMRTAR